MNLHLLKPSVYLTICLYDTFADPIFLRIPTVSYYPVGTFSILTFSAAVHFPLGGTLERDFDLEIFLPTMLSLRSTASLP